MSLSYKSWVGSAALLAVILIILLGLYEAPITQAETSTPDCPAGTQFFGWAWSSSIGWISFNSSNSTGSGGRHCVVVDDKSKVVGWAWSSNIGWIKFGGLSNFPAGGSSSGDAAISGGQMVGWARACAGTLTGNCSTMSSRTDGWDGWIELSGANHALTYSGGTVTGFAWGSNVVGWTQFDLSYNSDNTPPGGPPGGGGSASCSLNSVRNTDGSYTLSWNQGGEDANLTSCTGVNFAANNLVGSAIVHPSSSGTTYSLSCSTKTGTTLQCNSSRSLTGPTGGPDIQMWLDNDPEEVKASETIHEGQPAKINWRVNTGTYTGCLADLSGSPVNDFDNTQHPNGIPFLINNLTAGTYTFHMSCSTPPPTIKTVSGKVHGTEADSMTIRVISGSLQEI